jgi:hypothetical protein
MSSIGPVMPPSPTATNKRRNEESVLPTSTSLKCAQLPQEEQVHKRRRIVGPALPSPSIVERSRQSSSSGSDSEDDFGPALPPAERDIKTTPAQNTRDKLVVTNEAPVVRQQRDSWMLAPPDPDSWSTRVDPTKLRNRKFNAGKGAKAPSQIEDSKANVWTETPEQKRKRLQNEIMGTKRTSGPSRPPEAVDTQDPDTIATDARIKDYNVSWRAEVSSLTHLLTSPLQDRNRNTSLYAQHASSHSHEEEDDPSMRAFDKEKDIRGGVTVNHTKRKELLSRAADFGNRFSKGKYL